ncbi:MAG: polysaccharide export protein [Gemmatimonadetes bacterium]|nr:polysaccharide export protein [Gemmatimonadota bacterium]
MRFRYSCALRHALTRAVAAILLATTLGPTRAFAQSRAPEPESVVLAPGDFLRVSVQGRPDLSGDFVIAPNGSITHPLLREITAAGVPMPQLEQRLRTFFARYLAEPAFVISPMMHVFVGGAVRSAGNYIAPPGTTLDQAVLLSGGVVEDAERGQLLLVRAYERTVVDLTVDSGRQGAALVRSGDQVYVPQQRHVMRDVIIPTIMVLGALTGIVNLVVTLSRRN